MSLALALTLLQAPVTQAVPVPTAATDLWVIDHQGIEARFEDDLVVQVMRNPVLTRGDVELEAAMAIFWLDREALESRRILPDGTSEPVDPVEGLPRDIFDDLAEDPASHILREVYFEGPVVYRSRGSKVGSASAFYMNLVSETGWIADAEFLLDHELRGREVSWRARSEWLQRKPARTLHSNHAVVTSCTFVDRHLFVLTEDLVVAPLKPEAGQEVLGEEDPGTFEVNLSGNSLRAYDLVSLPLPPLSWRADQRGRPILPEVKIGSSARFGSFVQTALSFDVSGLGDRVHRAFGADTEDPERARELRSDGRLGVSLLGSRGVLLDLGVLLEDPGLYTWDVAIGGLFDGDDDRGLLRVDPSDREELRTWLRSRGRFHTGTRAWLDLALSTQSDPGVQAEFFEDEFLTYEQRENYLHWRTAGEGTFVSARVKGRLNSDRSQTEELPRLRAVVDRRPVLELFETSLLYSSDSEAGWLRRREGDAANQSPFAPPTPYLDGLADEDVLRTDTTHRVELPLRVLRGWRLAPYLEARGTAWDRDQLDDEAATRLDLVGGARLSTLFWRRFSGGTTAQLAPFLEARHSIVHEEDSGEPLLVDAVDLPTGADELGLGLRAHLFGWREADELDVEARFLRTDHEDVEAWDHLEVFAGLRTRLFDRPLTLSHDGRYDLDAGTSLTTRTGVGVRPTDALGLELIHSRALDELGDVLYEAATIQGVYAWTPKWEFQGRQTVSFLDESSLAHEFVLRRYGHDLVFEAGVSRVSGEGGTTITLRLRPEALFRRPTVGNIQHR